MIIYEEDYIAHYGILRRSGRYPWGSGGKNEPLYSSFTGWVNDLKSQGFTKTEIARAGGISTTDLRALVTRANNEQKQADINMAQRLRDKGMGPTEIGRRMGKNESSIRALLAPGASETSNIVTLTSNILKSEVNSKDFIDIGAGVENYLGVSAERLNVAVAMLKDQGYEVHKAKVPIIGTYHDVELKILCKPGTTQKEAWLNRFNVNVISQYSKDGGRTFTKTQPPISVNPKRVSIRYKEDGGATADGVLYIRPGVKDLSLGGKNYAQVRVKVGDGHYLKGMAVYKDNLPDGVDIVYNVNKSDTGNKLDAMKQVVDSAEYPFGSIVRQITSPNGKVSSAINIVYEEGQWSGWKKSISAQSLSKQSLSLAKTQLKKTYSKNSEELKQIMSLTNPSVKKKLLQTFSDNVDSSAVHLKAASLPRSNWHAILPIDSISPTEVYAPNYRDGEKVVLIRYPHGGTFEIPTLIVNNKNSEARKLIGDAADAIGIHHEVASRLSGADFDGDTVLLIPNEKGQIKSSPPLESLKNFDPQSSYPYYEGMKVMSESYKQQAMGSISNLVTDMTIRGAPHKDIARAVRHSMVVIDAVKHKLDYRQSAIDNGIAQLKKEYQGGANSGATTIVSRASSTVRGIPDRKLRPASQGGPVDPKTGAIVYVPTDKQRRNKNGDLVPVLTTSTRLAETNDAHTLSSGTPMEKLYADHANSLKALANKARLEMINTEKATWSQSAKRIYAPEVASLSSKLKLSKANKPLERQAQVIAGSVIKQKLASNPDLSGDSIKKLKYQELENARARMEANKKQALIEITPKEWDAIQAGALSPSAVNEILNNTNLDLVRAYASPKYVDVMTASKTEQAKSLLSTGLSRSEVADRLGVSVSTLDKATSVKE